MPAARGFAALVVRFRTRHGHPRARNSPQDQGDSLWRTQLTIADRLTSLEVGEKTDDDAVHDKDDEYEWSVGSMAADGGVFTTFPFRNSAQERQ